MPNQKYISDKEKPVKIIPTSNILLKNIYKCHNKASSYDQQNTMG